MLKASSRCVGFPRNFAGMGRQVLFLEVHRLTSVQPLLELSAGKSST